MSSTPVSVYPLKKIWLQNFLLWLLFLLICLGLGYATLSRYDPSKIPSLSDAAQYARMVDQSAPAGGWFRYRILIPYLAKPIYHLVQGHIGSWSPVFFSLLCVNAFFVATAALLLFRIGQTLLPNPTTALIGVLLYLLNFNIVNSQLVGLIDSGETLFLILVTWALLKDRWYILPVLGILGVLAKESFIPIATVFAAGWWIVDYRNQPNSLNKIVWVILMGLAGLATYSSVRWILGVGPVSPLDIAASAKTSQSFALPLNKHMLYGFAWLLPLGVLRLRDFPIAWIVASVFGFIVILLLAAWGGAVSGTLRYTFNLTGGLLSLSAAVFLESMLIRNEPRLAR